MVVLISTGCDIEIQRGGVHVCVDSYGVILKAPVSTTEIIPSGLG